MIRYNNYFIGISLMICFLNISNDAASQNLMDELRSHQNTIHFAKALEQAHINQKLENGGPFTIFVPVGKAFNSMSDNMKMNNDLLLNHIMTGMATERNLKLMSQVTCLSGKKINIKSDKDRGILINDLTLHSEKIKADNGIIYIIDGVIK